MKRDRKVALECSAARPWWLATVAVAVGLLSPRAAEAHPPPEALGVGWATDGTTESMVVHTTRGLLVEEPATGEFLYLCREAIGLVDAEAAPMAFGSDGSVLVVSETTGVVRSPGDLCAWSPASPPLEGRKGFHIAASPTAGTFYVVTVDAGRTDNLFRSADDGQAWELLESNDVPFTRVAVAPSEPLRLYRSGSGFDPATGRFTVISVSRDGGVTWTSTPLEITQGVLQHFVVGVHPQNPDHVFIRAQASSTGLPEQLLLSTDAGGTFTEVLAAPDLLAFASTPSGDVMWAGSGDGIHRSTDGGQSFSLISGSGVSRVACLEARGGELFACANQDSRLGVSVSADGGDSFEQFLDFADVTRRLDCPQTSKGGTVCDAAFLEWEREVVLPSVDGGASSTVSGGGPSLAGAPSVLPPGSGGTGGAPMTGGAAGDAPSPSDADGGGCSCRLHAHATRARWSAFVLLSVGAGVARRRRRPARRS